MVMDEFSFENDRTMYFWVVGRTVVENSNCKLKDGNNEDYEVYCGWNWELGSWLLWTGNLTFSII